MRVQDRTIFSGYRVRITLDEGGELMVWESRPTRENSGRCSLNRLITLQKKVAPGAFCNELADAIAAHDLWRSRRRS